MTDRHLLWTILIVALFTLALLVTLNDGHVEREEAVVIGSFMAGAGLVFALLRGGKKDG